MTQRRGLMLILSSPSGAGKTTLSRRLLEGDPETRLSISVTTRPPRPAEKDGRDYHFVNQIIFEEMVKAGSFWEYATVFGHSYGTPREAVEEHLAAGHDVLFDIDWQGTQQLAQDSHEDLVRIFILPPSIKELERRLRERAQDSEEDLQKRLRAAVPEISHWAEYDYVLVNDDLEESLDQIKNILSVERMRRHRQPDLVPFAKNLVEDAKS